MSTTSYVSYPLPLPLLTIKTIPGGTRRGCYSEMLFELVSRSPIKPEHWAHLDACGLIGLGQAYSVISTEEMEVESAPVMVDKATGEPTGEPVTWNGEPFSKPNKYVYNRYVVRRICDSGD